MSESQCRQITILSSKDGEARDENTKRMNEVCETFAQKDQVGVTTNSKLAKLKLVLTIDKKPFTQWHSTKLHPNCFISTLVKKPFGRKRRTYENELDNPCSSRCDLSEGVYMSHNIMTTFLLFNSSHLELFRSKVLSWWKKGQNLMDMTWK